MKHQDIIEKLTRRQKADLMSGRDFWSTLEIKEVNLPSMYLSDGPHGLRKQAAEADHLGLNASIPATCYPTAATMANTWDVDLATMMATALGEEARVQGVSVLLGPGMNIKRNPRCGRNFEYFSEDPYLAGKMASSYSKGIQSNGISSCLKHFAGNNREKRRMTADSVIDERALREIYLTGFEIAIKEGQTKSIMSSYNVLNGQFANENVHLLKEILREEWGYKGIIVTDWGGCNDRVEGAKCTNELEMPHCKYGNDDIYKALEEGKLEESVVDECIDRLIDLVLETHKAIETKPEKFDVDKHHEIAYKCASESMVLLKNDENVLPLSKDDKIAIVGDFASNPRYQGAGSSVVNPTKLDNFLEIAKEEKLNYTYAQGFDRYGKEKKKLVKEAIEACKDKDKILLFLGLDEITEAEGLDRDIIRIPNNQITLLNELKKMNKKIIVVLSCGSSVEMAEINKADGIIYACLTGQAGAKAIYDVVFGVANPSGKLAETFPVSYDDCSSSSYFDSDGRTIEYRESIYVGYRYYDKVNKEVSYPFGFGLSYTTFEYSNLTVDENSVSFDVTNSGNRDGKEIVQLYVGKESENIFRAKKELKGFKKVSLAKGETKRVTIPFDEYTFRYFNVKTNKWEIEGGKYNLYVAASSRDIRLTGEIEKASTTDVLPYDKEKLASYYSCDVKNVTDAEFKELLGRDIPTNEFNFYKKNRLVVDENTTVGDLRYSRRWIGRLFSWGIRFAIKFLKGIGQRNTANTLIMGVYYQPVRGLAKFGGMNRRQMEALMMMLNGHACKGIHKFLHKSKDEKEEIKKEKEKQKQAKKRG